MMVSVQPWVDDNLAQLMTVEEFRQAVAVGAYVDYDGFGYPVQDGTANTEIMVKPSKLGDIPEGAMHIVWFNR